MAFSMTVAPAVYSSVGSMTAQRVQNITSSTRWRDVAQLRGLQANHPSLPIFVAPLAPPATALFSSTQLALHPTEDAVAIGLTSMADPQDAGSIGLLSITSGHTGGDEDPVIDFSRIEDHTSTIRWLDVSLTSTNGQHVSSIEWGSDLLYVGCSDGAVCIGDYGLGAALEPSSGFACAGTLSAAMPDKATSSQAGALPRYSPSGFATSSAIRSLHSGAALGSNEKLLAGHEGGVVVWDLNGESTPLWRGACVTSADGSEADDVVLVARWAPHCGGSATVCASGTYKGVMNLHDIRVPASSASATIAAYSTAASSSPSSSTSSSSIATSITSVEFHPSLPWLLASAAADGVLRLYDLRFPRTGPIMPISTCQGGVTSLKWVPTHPDLLMSCGRDASTRLWCLRSSPSFCVGTWKHRLPLMDLATTSSFARVQCLGVGLDGELVAMHISDEALSSVAPTQFVPTPAATTNSSTKKMKVLRDESVQRGLSALYCRNIKDACGALLEAVNRAVSAQDHHTATSLLEHLSPCPVHPFRLDVYLEMWRSLLDSGTKGSSNGGKTNALGLAPTSSSSSAISMLLAEASPFLGSPINGEVPEYPMNRTSTGASSSFSVTKLRALLEQDLELFARRVPEHIRVFGGGGSAMDSESSSNNSGGPLLRGLPSPSAAQRTRIEALRLNIDIQRCCEENNPLGAMQILRTQSSVIRRTPSAVEYLNAETLCSVVGWLVNPTSAVARKQQGTLQLPVAYLEKRYLDARVALDDVLDALILPNGTSPSKPLVRRIVLAALSPIVVDGGAGTDGETAQLAAALGDGAGKISDKKPSATSDASIAKRRRKWIDKAVKDLRALRAAVGVQLHVVHIAALREYAVTLGAGSDATAGLRSIVDVVSQYQESIIAGSDDDEDRAPTSLGIFSWLSESAIVLYLDELSRSSVSGLAVFLWTSVQFLHHLSGMSSRAASKIETMFFNVLNRFERGQQKLKGQLKAVVAVLDPDAHSDDDEDEDEDESPARRRPNAKKPLQPPPAAAGGGTMRKRQVQQQLTILDTLLPQVHAYATGVLKLQLEIESIADASGIDRDSDDLPKLMASALELLNQCSSDILEVWADTLDAAREERRIMEDDAKMPVKKIVASSASAQRRAAASASGPSSSSAPSSSEEAMLRLLKHVDTFADDCNHLLEQSTEGANDEMINNVLDICEEFGEEWHPPTRK